MEKIQEAIARARTERQGQPQGQEQGQEPAPGAAADAPPSAIAPPTAAPETVTPETAAPVADAPQAALDIAAHWESLPEMKPSEARLRRSHVVTYEAGRASSDFDVIRTRILQLQRANGWTRIAITSPTPSCGKTTLALNLAFSLARQADRRIMLCELDFRRPALARLAGIRQKHTISRVLEGRETFESNAVRIGTNLILATNAQSVRNASEILQGAAASRALGEITDRYQPTTMIFDMPPLLAGDDTMGFLVNVDATILIAAAESTSIKQIDVCERDIATQSAVMGVILNKCRYMDRDTGYGQYGYG